LDYLLFVAALHTINIDALTNGENVFGVGGIYDENLVAKRNEARSELVGDEVDDSCVKSYDTCRVSP
jgi:hypothetical protein